MGKLLSGAAVAQYQEKGYYFPVRVLSPEEAAGYRGRLESYEAETGGPLKSEMKHKTHLLFRWAADMVRLPKLLDAIEDLIGPDILCWSTTFFIKEANSPAYISYHQDLTYWGLDPADVVTAWIALSPATLESGAMRFLPGSHTTEVLPHKDTFAKDNLLTRGQEVDVEVDESKLVDILLQPGEMSLHHVKLVHGSMPNRSADRRIGFAVRYIPPSVRQVAGAADSAMLVRGEDRHGNFELEDPPAFDLDPASVARHQAITARQQAILYRGTDIAQYRESVRMFPRQPFSVTLRESGGSGISACRGP